MSTSKSTHSTILANVALTVWLCLSFQVYAVEDWANLGLYGGQINDIAIDPDQPDKMFAGSSEGDGLFKTLDGGTTWKPVLTGHEGGALEREGTFRNMVVFSVEIAPSDPNTVWAVHDHWAEVSRDGGNTWTHIYNRDMQNSELRFCRSLAIGPKDPSIVYVGTGGPQSSDTNGAVYKTTDAGESWTKLGDSRSKEFDYNVIDVEINPKDGRVLWALTFNDADAIDEREGSLYVSANGGLTWGLKKLTLQGTFIADLVVNPHEPNVVFIATYDGIVRVEYPKDAQGNVLWNQPTWTFPVGWEGGRDIRTLAIDPFNKNRVYYAGFGSQFGVSNDGGRSFPISYEIGLQLITLSIHSKSTNILFGGERLLGLYKTLNGVDWSAINEGVNALKINDIAADPQKPDYLIAATSAGVFKKEGEGTWQPSAKLTNTEAFSVAFDPSDPSGSSYFAGIESYLAKTEDGGKTWRNSDSLDDSGSVDDIAVDAFGETVFITTRQPGSVWKSTDGGQELTRITPPGADFDFNAVALDPSDSERVYAGGGDFFGEKKLGALFVSEDGGSTWTESLSRVIVNALLIDPDNPEVIYAGCGYSGGTPVPLFRSTDRGQTWRPASKGLPGMVFYRGIWGSALDDIHMPGHTGSLVKGGYDDRRISHYTGVAWSEKDAGVFDHLSGIWGTSGSEIFAVGAKGAIVYYNGVEWSPMETNRTRTTNLDLNAVWGTSSANVYAVGNEGEILHYDGAVWTRLAGKTSANLRGIWGTENGKVVYAVGSSGTLLKKSGDGWVPQRSGTKAELTGIWGTPTGTDVFVVGAPERDRIGELHYTILRWSGSGWSKMVTPKAPIGKAKLRAIWGSSRANVFAVGDDGVILHYDGNERRGWVRMKGGTVAELHGLWGTDDGSRVYAVGQYGTVIQYDGLAWTIVTSGLESGVRSANPVTPISLPGYMAQWNSVTDLKLFVKEKNRNVYAATYLQGIYLLPRGGESWINRSSPPYNVYALEIGSIYVAAYGVFTFQGHGLIAGVVRDKVTGVGLDNARVQTVLGFSKTTNVDGEYWLSLRAGTFDVTAEATGYHQETAYNVPPILEGNTVNFFLIDPLVEVWINNVQISASDGEFDSTYGRIRPKDGELYGWVLMDNKIQLMVPYPNGWVTLSIEPQAGYRIKGVWVDDTPQGIVSEYTFTSPNKTQKLRVEFEPDV